MKKLKTNKEIEDDKKKRRNNFIIGGVMIFLLVIAPAGYAILTGNRDNNSLSTNVLKYNDIKFYRQTEYFAVPSDLLNLNIKTESDKVFYFRFMPQDVENISVSSKINQNYFKKYHDKPLYFASVSDNKQNNEISSKRELLINLNDIVLREQDACLNLSVINQTKISAEYNCTKDAPFKDCNSNIVVFISEDNWQFEDVYVFKNCVFINADKAHEYVKKTDAFLYNLFEVI